MPSISRWLLLGGCLFASPALSASGKLPAQAQLIDQRKFNVLNNTRPPAEFNDTNIFVPPGMTEKSLTSQPFHVYDEEFLKIIGSTPTLTRIAYSAVDPLFHEAVVWSKGTDEVFFAQNAGPPEAGTGLKKSSIIEKISLAKAAAVANKTDAVGLVTVHNVTSPEMPKVMNPNGGNNYRGKLIFAGEGQGNDTAPALYVMNPKEPYDTEILLNNFFGRQFNSLNDVAIHPNNTEVYFTDVPYGYYQDFRPSPGLQNQVYRFNPDTGAVRIAADGFTHPNGFTFSPDGKYAYVTDTGVGYSFYGNNLTEPSSIYRFDVTDDGTLENRKTFAFASPGLPDGVHCDSWGNVYAGCGDGIQVWNPSGKLIGKIFVGTTSANFNFAGKGRMVICAENSLYYATLAAAGNYVESQM
ncbi:SMP-30/Gluconolaconase/LRE-like region [Penicillium cosmopolitanum]|uniref:SMP-30/Gluconolaconase/LRE-like region n=1 Tax=Penicillium cosmopolitanum TaxID=1131564 RepID=A0A9W9W532_9EURO|nr:SMP-30/Gluconolaconase/LRE-like region [Penicillium cosmopolitanum]KAJ5403644.1 SMP-30/Gluconolaconase/LRE-like region [Penicillium cosmopolitanum]